MAGSNKRTELDWVEWLAARAPVGPGVDLGIGDDGAVLTPPAGSRLVFASDQVVEGVHFTANTEPERVGRKSLARNLSDLAAMGARPWAAVVSAALPRDRPSDDHERVFEGLFGLARRFEMAVVGGDLASVSDRLALDVAVLGLLEGRAPLVRSGARPGDLLAVTGALGGSILGKHLDFEPRVTEALALARNFEVHAAIDISDGLVLDLARLARASGARAQLDLARIPVAPAAFRLAAAEGGTPLDHALTDGEDYELLVAMAPSELERVLARKLFDTPLSVIGQIVAGVPGVVDASGRELSSRGAGYQHDL